MSNSTLTWQMKRMLTGFASGAEDDDAFDDSAFLLRKKSIRPARVSSSTLTKLDARGFEERKDKKLKNVGMSAIDEADEDEGHYFDNDQPQYSEEEEQNRSANISRKITLGYTGSGKHLIEAERTGNTDKKAVPGTANMTIQNAGSLDEPSPINDEEHAAEA